MNNSNKQELQEVVGLVGLIVALVVGLAVGSFVGRLFSVGVGVGVLVGVVGVGILVVGLVCDVVFDQRQDRSLRSPADFVVGCDVVLDRRRDRSAADLRTVPPEAARSLRWVRGLLPRDEGTAWWAEVTSHLADAPDKSTRRRYVRSYLRGVPRLIWTSWTERLRASRQRELS